MNSINILDINSHWYSCCPGCNVKLHLYCLLNYIRNATYNEYNEIMCPHCRKDFSTNNCLCYVSNYIRAFSHKTLVLQGHIRCKDCSEGDKCIKWYKPCKCHENI